MGLVDTLQNAEERYGQYLQSPHTRTADSLPCITNQERPTQQRIEITIERYANNPYAKACYQKALDIENALKLRSIFSHSAKYDKESHKFFRIVEESSRLFKVVAEMIIEKGE